MEKRGHLFGEKIVLLFMIAVIFFFLVGIPNNFIINLSNTLTGMSITVDDINKETNPFSSGKQIFLDPIIYILFLALFSFLLLVSLFKKRVRKKMILKQLADRYAYKNSPPRTITKPIKAEKSSLQKKNEENNSLKKWRGKEELFLSSELKLINSKLRDLKDEDPERGVKIIGLPDQNKKRERRKFPHLKPTILEAPENDFRQELRYVNQELSAVKKILPEKVKIISSGNEHTRKKKRLILAGLKRKLNLKNKKGGYSKKIIRTLPEDKLDREKIKLKPKKTHLLILSGLKEKLTRRKQKQIPSRLLIKRVPQKIIRTLPEEKSGSKKTIVSSIEQPKIKLKRDRFLILSRLKEKFSRKNKKEVAPRLLVKKPLQKEKKFSFFQRKKELPLPEKHETVKEVDNVAEEIKDLLRNDFT